MNSIDLKNGSIYSEDDIMDFIRKSNPSISDTKGKWILFELVKSKRITRVGTKVYVVDGERYECPLSENAKRINMFLTNTYPDLDYVIWESSQLNEWMNFLFAKNIIFVEVESSVKDAAFSFLQEEYGKSHLVLLSPDIDTISRYISNDLIVIKPLFSKSPKNKKSHQIAIEKIIVDVFADRLLKEMIGTNDREEIAHGIVSHYAIDKTKALSYATRRNCANEVRNILQECAHD